MAVIQFSTKSKTTRKQREKQKDAWEEYKAKYGLVENKAKTYEIVKTYTPTPKFVRPGSMDFKTIQSVDSGGMTATKPSANVYTGSKVIGIGTMHKSNLVPIFSEEAAVDISKMRRND
jgi:hypothetical protein